MRLELNELERARFGMVAARLVDPRGDLDDVLSEARHSGIEFLSARVHVDDLDSVHSLEAAGFRLMDTLVYYGCALVQRPDEEDSRPSHVSVRAAVQSDKSTVQAVAAAAFHGYLGHYHADPRLDENDADAVYVEWAGSSVAGQSESRPVLVACENREAIGFLTLRDVGERTAEIVLNGVDPDYQGRGVYRTLLGASLALAREAGSERLIVSTQINNYSVQRVWANMGLLHERSLYTFHLWLEK